MSIKALDACLVAGDVAQAEQLLEEQVARLSMPGAYPSKLKEAVMYTFIFLMGSLSSPLPQRGEKEEILAEVDSTVLESRSLTDMRRQMIAALGRIAETSRIAAVASACWHTCRTTFIRTYLWRA